jgi:hypothetical protein
MSKSNRLLKKAHLLRYASDLAAHVPLKYAPLLDPCDALQLNLFEQPAKPVFFKILFKKTASFKLRIQSLTVKKGWIVRGR